MVSSVNAKIWPVLVLVYNILLSEASSGGHKTSIIPSMAPILGNVTLVVTGRLFFKANLKQNKCKRKFYRAQFYRKYTRLPSHQFPSSKFELYPPISDESCLAILDNKRFMMYKF